MRGQSQWMHGVRFYVPELINDKARSAIEIAIDIGVADCDVNDKPHVDGAYVLTSSGEHRMSDILRKPPVRIESDLRRELGTM